MHEHTHTPSYAWGALADKKGRKPVVITSCVLIGLSSAAFGFSVQIYMAVVFRFFVGLFYGETLVLRMGIPEPIVPLREALTVALTPVLYSS